MPDKPQPAASIIAFQGAPGAYSHLACREMFPQLEALPTPSFEDAFAAVEEGRAELAMIPIENSQAGRVADIHFLLPESKLHIIAEHFHRVQHCLLAVPGADIRDIRAALSHPQALGQTRSYLRSKGIAARAHQDTADAARAVAELGDKSLAAIASRLAAEIYRLAILDEDIEDATHNTTRFVVLAREPRQPEAEAGPIMTSLFFAVRNVPAALYKALGGFATNGVNITKLESYLRDGQFVAAEFYADIEGHPQDPHVALALEELRFHTRWVRVLGSYTIRRDRHTGAMRE
ncbi:MAG: prephenate dehydratase [Pseudomonadota bacterium]